MQKCNRSNFVNLIKNYNIVNQKAHTAYMQGQLSVSADYYDQAFNIGVELLSLPFVSIQSLDYCVAACFNCIEYGDFDDKKDCFHYLSVTQSLLAKIILKENFHKDIRSIAFGSWVEVSNLLIYREYKCDKNSIDELTVNFNEMWDKFSRQLLIFH